MDAAYLFGTTGNLPTALGAGWSVEDTFAWTIGAESQLTLPLPADDRTYILRLDVHPAIFPPKVLRQRIMIRAGKIVLGSFEVTARTMLVIPLPVALTNGGRHLDLTLIHPDAVRPRDHIPLDDARRLAICFHAATLHLARAANIGQDGRPQLEPLHGIIAGGATAMNIREVIGKLPTLSGKFGIRFLDLSQASERAAQTLPPGTFDTMQFCWIELSAGTPARRDLLRQQLNPGCAIRTFYAPTIRSFWPFLADDSRAAVEPGRYNPARYPYGDRLALALAGTNISDDACYTMYEASAEHEPIDLDEIFAGDLRRWQAEGNKSDMRLADFIDRHLSTSRLFVAPDRVGPMLLREMVDQVLDLCPVHNFASTDELSTEVDALLDGYIGWQHELPIHRRVADHFRMAWWSPEMKYRLMSNRLTYREYILNYIGWVPWLP